MLAMYASVEGSSGPHARIVEGKVTLILVSAIAREKEAASSPANLPQLEFKNHIQKSVIFNKKPRLLQGICDFSLWYGADNRLETNFVVLASSDETQCLACMGRFDYLSLDMVANRWY